MKRSADTRRDGGSLIYKFGKMQIEQKLEHEDNDGRFKKIAVPDLFFFFIDIFKD